jgi:5-methylcytosine-specific restriction endonuclease McrA
MNCRKKLSGGKDWIWEPTREAIYHRDGDQCISCGRREPFTTRERRRYRKECSILSIDHVDPSGGNAPSNLVTLCNDCNIDKGERSYREYDRSLVRVVRVQTAKPLDRVEGRRRANILRPGRLASHYYRTRTDVRAARTKDRAAILEALDFGSPPNELLAS